MQQVFLPPSLLFIQDFALMFFICVYITDISDYLVAIMLLCRYVASVDQVFRTFQVSQQRRQLNVWAIVTILRFSHLAKIM